MRKILPGLLLAGATVSLHAQIFASGTVSGVPDGSGNYNYTLIISDAANAPTAIGSIWYSWVPGGFFLPSVPLSATGPAGWAGSVVANSIQYQSTSPGVNIAPGSSVTFHYVASFSPAQLAAAPNSGLSFAYAGAVDASTPQQEFTVQLVVPEPSSLTLGLLSAAGLIVRRKLRSA